MKRIYRYYENDKVVERKYNYIPFRYILAILITLYEVAAMIGIVMLLCVYVPYFYILCWITQIVCVINIIASDDNPDYKVPWLLFMMILPIAGFMLYFLFYSRKLKNKYVKRLKALKDNTYYKDDTELFRIMQSENPTAASQAKMLCDISEGCLFTNTKQTYYPIGEEMYPQLL